MDFKKWFLSKVRHPNYNDWKEIESYFKTALDSSFALTETCNKSKECKEYLREGEYELALDNLIELPIEARIPQPHKYWKNLLRAANKMNLIEVEQEINRLLNQPTKFEIESIFNVTRRGKCIAAKQITFVSNWELSENSYLGGLKIHNWTEIPRAIDKTGNQRYDLFIFKPDDEKELANISEGDILELK
ncbi:MAG: hypothetical protein R2728_03245 [Chitinophagales bacterium]